MRIGNMPDCDLASFPPGNSKMDVGWSSQRATAREFNSQNDPGYCDDSFCVVVSEPGRKKLGGNRYQ